MPGIVSPVSTPQAAQPARGEGARSIINTVPLRSTLAPLRNGAGDPTTVLGAGELWRATHTPLGPGTVRLTWATGRTTVRTWGAGGPWLADRVEQMLGRTDAGHVFVDAHPAIMRAQHRHPDVRIGGSGTLYHELLPTILAQRITAGEAVAQWRRLCLQLGDAAPGPHASLRLPPHPDRLAAMPSWWFHPLGIERSRADTLRTVARHATHLWAWGQLPVAQCAQQLALLRGVGEWTIGVVLASALGEPDAVAVGDYHLKNIVAHALAGEPRATDERMLQLLQPYRGQRGRAVRLLMLDGHRAPTFGPRRRILPMHRW